jgi:ribonuclease Z
MARLTLLGSSAAIASAIHDNVYMVLNERSGAWLIDCAGSPLQRLALTCIPTEDLKGLIVTHHHSDHAYGVPILLLGLWLLDHRLPLPIYGPPESLEVISNVIALYEPVEGMKWFTGHPIAPQEKTPLLSTEEVEVIASPVKHAVPTIGLRITSRVTGRAIVYSSDTEPCEAVARLAAGADILLHEATGAYPGHSTGAGAAEIARRAGVKRLVLIHYPVVPPEHSTEVLKEARKVFAGPVELAEDFNSYEL